MKWYLRMEDGTAHRVGESWVPIECFRCGSCCIHYRAGVTQGEIALIAQEMGIPMPVFISKYVRVISGKMHVLQNDEDKCPFLSWDDEAKRGTCTIYHLRPEACRNWLASLSYPQCREGLLKLRTDDKILLPDELYSSLIEVEKLCSALISDNITELK